MHASFCFIYLVPTPAPRTTTARSTTPASNASTAPPEPQDGEDDYNGKCSSANKFVNFNWSTL